MFRIFGVLAICVVARPATAAEFRFQHENVIGTSAEFHIHCDSSATATATEALMLGEIDRLSAIYSTWDEDSELNRWARAGKAQISAELRELLEQTDRFRQLSKEAFNPRVAAATRFWQQAETAKELPSVETIAATAKALRDPAWTFNADDDSARCLVEPGMLTFDAIAKGLIIDRLCELALKRVGVTAVVVNIGGDLRVAGTTRQFVSIESHDGTTNGLPPVRLEKSAIATSSGRHRFFEILDQRFSHIIDPRTATPIKDSVSISVIAPTATAADAMATALGVFDVDEAIRWCDQHAGYDCLIAASDGTVHTSRGWPAKHLPQTFLVYAPAADEWPKDAKLSVDFELNRPNTTRYRRPYVAVWIEDSDGFPVRTLVLWLQAGRGARWHRDLKRWYKQDSLRKLVDGKALIGTISAATRPAGKYKTAWDGKDDQGKFVKQGEYTLYIEAAREHGTYQLTQQPLVIGPKAASGVFKGNAEIKSASYAYTP